MKTNKELKQMKVYELEDLLFDIETQWNKDSALEVKKIIVGYTTKIKKIINDKRTIN